MGKAGSRTVVAFALALCSACSDATSPAGAVDDAARVRAHLTIVGSAESSAGATWTYRDTLDGIAYDLAGVLYKPAGNGPFPGLVLSHGHGGSAPSIGRSIGAKVVAWPLVVIATNYTHAGNVPIGAPGTAALADLGASVANVQRARRAIAILHALGYVDTNRIAAYGSSMGAFVTTALAATHGDQLRVAAHSAGGVRLAGWPIAPAPPDSQARRIRIPYQMHHGDQDPTVPLAADQRLRAVLEEAGTQNELVIYPGAGHSISADPAVLANLRAWYTRFGMF